MLPAPPDLDALQAPIIARFADYRARGLMVIATSSFQTNSLVLLALLGRHAPDVPVYFLDTGYHFPETLGFRDALGERLGLDIRTLRSPVPRDLQRDGDGRLLFGSDPDHCCHLNKVLPLDPVLLQSDVWVSGVRAGQSAHRATLRTEDRGRHGILRYHPLLAWSARDVHAAIEAFDLPRHPLEAQGYLSVGCQPCTRSLLDGGAGAGGRGGRWSGLKKTECGLHLDAGPAAGGGR